VSGWPSPKPPSQNIWVFWIVVVFKNMFVCIKIRLRPAQLTPTNSALEHIAH
jgi:hypothetical protein